MCNAHTVNNQVPDEGIAVQRRECLRGNFTKSFQKAFANSNQEKQEYFLFQSRKNRVPFWFNFSLAIESKPVKLLESIEGIKNKKKTQKGRGKAELDKCILTQSRGFPGVVS